MPKLSEGVVALGGLAAFAAWLFIGLPLLYLPTEIHNQPEIHSSQPAQPTNTQPNGSLQSPFFVQAIPGAQTAEERAQEAEDREEKKSADRWLVRWTAALFLATLGLIVATLILAYFAFRQMRDMEASIAVAEKSADAAKDAANAANITADAAVRAAQAHVYPVVENENVVGTVRSGISDSQQIKVSYRLRNYGKTPAIIKVAGAELVHGIRSEPPEQIIGELSFVEVVEVLAPNATTDPPTVCSLRNFSSADIKSIREGETTIWLHGFIEYKDVMGLDRRLEYWWWYERRVRRFGWHSFR
jgi:hypothetical protein